MKNRFFFTVSFICTLLLTCIPNALAIYLPPKPPTGLGEVAGNIFGIEMHVHDLLHIVCITAGAGMLMGALIKYNKHRQNPLEVTIGSIITNIIIGIALIVLAFVPFMVD